MDKKALQTYAVWAKTNLEEQIEVSLKSLGINSATDIKEARRVGDYTIIDGDMNSYPADMLDKRNNIIQAIRKDGYKNVIEEFAYTWFNRIVALRFMEIHDFLPHGLRVLSSRDGSFEPEIMKNLGFVKDDLNIDLSVASPLLEQGKLDDAYRYVLFRQCRALSKILPMLFAQDQSYLELLLPKALLQGETFITKLIELGEEPFKNDVEVIGWLYQFYISKKKDEVFASKKTITKDTLPAVTQLFTPDWIVKYLAENSVGRIWLESYPNSSLRSQMKYYVDDAKQEADVQKKLDEIKYKNVNPEEIKIIEPCCGSGHILVYVFDLLYKMYEEKGYQPREIPTLILKNNIVGLDVDKRAAQLASFSLIMKARTMNSRFFNDVYYVKPQVYEIWDSRVLFATNYKKCLEDARSFTNDQIKQIEWLAETFRNAKTIGSLLKVEKRDFQSISNIIESIRDKIINNLFVQDFYNDGVTCLKYLLKQAEIMSAKYDVMITNPPYIGISSMEPDVKKYATENYPDSKTDMFAMFMEVPFVKKNGFRAMINMHSWMFLSSYEKLRKKIIMNEMIDNMVHLGAHAFEMIGGEVVQTTAFVLRNSPIATNGVYFRLVDEKDKEAAFLAGGGIIMNISSYSYIPQNVFAYWMSSAMASNFAKEKLSDFAISRDGMHTCGNDKFIRRWYEVDINHSCFNATDSIYAIYTGKKWFPYNKGGQYRKWYGNNEFVVDWYMDGKAIKNDIDPITKTVKSHGYNGTYAFSEGITWTIITSGSFSGRYTSKGYLFDAAGGKIFLKEGTEFDYFDLIGFLNSFVAQKYLDFVSPFKYLTGDILKLPVLLDKNSCVENLAKKNIDIEKMDWDSFETSYDFKRHPMI